MGSVTEPEWLRQPGLPCEFCGGPGHLIPVPERPILAVAETSAALDMPQLETRVACPEHRFLVKSRAARIKDEEYFAEHDHGRPVLNAPTYPEQISRALRNILNRRGKTDTP